MKIYRWISLISIAILLTACSSAAVTEDTIPDAYPATEVTAADTAYPAPELEATEAAASGYPAPVESTSLPDYPAPSGAADLPASCLVEGMTTYTDPDGRFCFAYPADFTAEEGGLVGPAQEPDAARARLLILIDPLESSLDLAGLIAARLGEYGDAAVQQSEVQLGGETAASLEPVPGDPGSRDVVSVHGGEAITLRFQPNVETYAQSRPDRDALVDIVLRSFAWLK